MSALASLVRAYDRLATRGEAPAFGYSQEKISYLVSLNEDGTPACPPIFLGQEKGKKRMPAVVSVPRPVKRTSGIAPNFLWDKTAYVLGVTAGAGKRIADEHAAFKDRHVEWLAGTNDAGLQALLRFLASWSADQFVGPFWPDEMRDQNVIFAMEGERRQNVFLHDRPAARDLWTRFSAGADKGEAVCLVTGERGPVARLHPSIKGVWGAQTAGASIISFNLDAFTSYGHEQGDNAPVSETAAFAYTTMLNRFLERGSGHRLQVGDASTVFWADASDAQAAGEAKDMFAAFVSVDEKIEGTKVGAILSKIAKGQPVETVTPDLPKDVRFFVFGLAPNAARLSVRFYLEDDFGILAQRYLRHLERIRIEPPPKDATPSLWRMLVETAPLRKTENIQPNLAGDTLRAILTGHPYPLTLLSTLLMRMRTDKQVRALRVGLLKAVLMDNFRYRVPEDGREVSSDKDRKEVPVSLDRDNNDPGYLLGRLFAAFEYAQTAALGAGVNATIRDQYYGTASATPRAVFPILQRKAMHHLSKLRKEKRGAARRAENEIGEIFDLADPETLFAPTLSIQRQALFAIGYYHQRNEFYPTKDTTETIEEETPA